MDENTLGFKLIHVSQKSPRRNFIGDIQDIYHVHALETPLHP